MDCIPYCPAVLFEHTPSEAKDKCEFSTRSTADFLEKATWTLAIVLLCLSLMSVFAIPKNVADNNPKTELSTDNATPLKDATPNQQQPQQQQPKK